MFSNVIKHQFPRASALRITTLSRASVHAKAPPNTKAQEEFYLATTFPDDFEASPLNIDDLQKMDQSMGNETPVVFDKAATEKHMSDIYESLFPKQPMAPMKGAKASKAPKEAEQEPSLDEM